MIQCYECYKKFKQITWTHLRRHSLSVHDYKIEYQLRKQDMICEETHKLKVQVQSKCVKFLKKAKKASGKSISLGMKRKKFTHFWGHKISLKLKGRKFSHQHRLNISKGRKTWINKNNHKKEA